jgi:hypothetical protein
MRLQLGHNRKDTAMINTQKFNSIVEAAKAKTNDKRWQNAIDKALAGVVSGWWIITELHDGIMVTTEGGRTYRVNGHCSCRAAELGQPCKHIALRRLLDLYNEAETAPAAEPVATKGATSARAPRIVRGVESDWRGNRYTVTRCDGWSI